MSLPRHLEILTSARAVAASSRYPRHRA